MSWWNHSIDDFNEPSLHPLVITHGKPTSDYPCSDYAGIWTPVDCTFFVDDAANRKPSWHIREICFSEPAQHLLKISIHIVTSPHPNHPMVPVAISFGRLHPWRLLVGMYGDMVRRVRRVVRRVRRPWWVGVLLATCDTVELGFEGSEAKWDPKMGDHSSKKNDSAQISSIFSRWIVQWTWF